MFATQLLEKSAFGPEAIRTGKYSSVVTEAVKANATAAPANSRPREETYSHTAAIAAAYSIIGIA